MGTDKLEKVLVRMAVSEDTISPSNETATGKIASQLKALGRGRTRGLQRRRAFADIAHEQVFISKFNLTSKDRF